MRRFIWGILIVNFFLLACSNQKPKRTVAEIPNPPAITGGSTSATLYTTTQDSAWTAIGQVFAVPEAHPYLTKARFYCRESYSWTGEKSDLKLVLRISRWGEQRPDGDPILVSTPSIIKKDFKIGWVEFEVPRIKLDSKSNYVAWLSLVGQSNPANSSIGILQMSPRTSSPPPNGGNFKEWQPKNWSTDYPQGWMVMWDQPNPDENLEPLTRAPWRQEQIGVNTSFNMSFENIP